MNISFYSHFSLSLDSIYGKQALHCPIELTLVGTNLPEIFPFIESKPALDSEDPPRL